MSVQISDSYRRYRTYDGGYPAINMIFCGFIGI